MTTGRIYVPLSPRSGMLSPYRDFHSERIRAHAKHDPTGGSMERKSWDDPAWLPVVLEEVGEVAHAMTYDAKNPDLRNELVQVGAMVAAWIDALDAGGWKP